MQIGNDGADDGGERWSSRRGFVLATIGAAVGLGNIWRFSYVVGENGGAAFLLVYLLCVLLLGIPLMLAEFAIGASARGDVVRAFGGPGIPRRWRAAGWIAALAAFLILGYYAVIAGWAYRYLAAFVLGELQAADRASVVAFFEDFTAAGWQPALWQALVLGSSIAVVALGVQRGIEAINRLLMPVLAAAIVAMAAYSLSLGSAGKGIAFLFSPDWSALTRPSVYLAALGQAFFSIGIGMGVLLTYGSYARERDELMPAAVAVAAGDTLVALAAGLAIFPAVFAFGLDAAQGPALAFLTLPELFGLMPGGRIFGLVFFGLLCVAALTSTVSLLEVLVPIAMRRLRWSRPACSAAIGACAFVAGLPSALGYGVLGHWRPFGMALLDAIDHVTSNLLLPVSALLTAVFVGWGWSRARALHDSGLDERALGRAWLLGLRFVSPALILVTLAWLALHR